MPSKNITASKENIRTQLPLIDTLYTAYDEYEVQIDFHTTNGKM